MYRVFLSSFKPILVSVHLFTQVCVCIGDCKKICGQNYFDSKCKHLWIFYYRLFLSGVDKLRALKEIEDAAKTMEESEGAKNLT